MKNNKAVNKKIISLTETCSHIKDVIDENVEKYIGEWLVRNMTKRPYVRPWCSQEIANVINLYGLLKQHENTINELKKKLGHLHNSPRNE